MIRIGKLKNLEPLPWLGALLQNEQLRGKAGVDGERGPQGDAGRDGADGKDGVDGRNGAPGLDGTHGLNGKDGINGRDGIDGQDGYDGADGRDGKDGERGLQGVAGKRGAKGAKGDKGEPPKHQIDTENGRIRFERPDGSWGGWLEIKQKVTQEVIHSGGGGAKLTNALQDIEHGKQGKFPDYSRITVTVVDLALTDFHRIVVCKTNAVTISLPPAALYYNSVPETGIIYSIVNDSANVNDITLAADGSELIDSANTWTVPPGASPKIITDGTKWHIF
jgi:hypothetical protein